VGEEVRYNVGFEISLGQPAGEEGFVHAFEFPGISGGAKVWEEVAEVPEGAEAGDDVREAVDERHV